MGPAPTAPELFAATNSSAVHLEMRDAYTPEDPLFRRWQAGERITASDVLEHESSWVDLVNDIIARGVRIRRARIVSEPLADFPRYEYECTGYLNAPLGEVVRWLPRQRASDLALPGNDFWVFDDRIVRFGLFAGDGSYVGEEVRDEPDVVNLCVAAFEAVWERAVPHVEYRPG